MKLSRRHFVTGLLSVPVIALGGVQSVGLDAKAPICVNSAPRKTQHMLLVCERYDKAVAVHRAMGKPTNVSPVGIGSNTCGYSADLIVVDDLPPFTPRGRNWWNCSVLTRLKPGGEIAEHKQAEPVVVDYDNQCVIASSCHTGETKSCRVATRFLKSRRDLTESDYIHATALNIMRSAKQQHGFVFEYPGNDILESWYNSKRQQANELRYPRPIA